MLRSSKWSLSSVFQAAVLYAFLISSIHVTCLLVYLVYLNLIILIISVKTTDYQIMKNISHTCSKKLCVHVQVRKKYSVLEEVRITVVDNFQGEENDIILLSLVRSNREAKIGFLSIENRVCVALSRAKMGFYIIGMY
jgi:hypothetical protein